MKTNLYWRPVQPTRSHQLPHALKSILARRYWGQGGVAEPDSPYRMDDDEVPYLTGLLDADVAGAADLIAALRQHRSVEVWIESDPSAS